MQKASAPSPKDVESVLRLLHRVESQAIAPRGGPSGIADNDIGFVLALMPVSRRCSVLAVLWTIAAMINPYAGNRGR